MLRTNTNTIEGAHCITIFFPDGVVRDRDGAERCRLWRKYMELTHHAGAGAGGLPRQRSNPRTATRRALYFGAPGARQGQVLFDARLGRSHRRLLPAQGRNARMQQRYRCRPGAQSEETGTMGQLYYPAAFFSYPAIMYFTAGVAGVFTALHHMWKASCKQEKKKVWVHGLLQRVHPRLVGSSRENRNANFAFSQLALFGVHKINQTRS